MTKSFEPAENDLPQVPPAAADGSDDTRDDLNGETTRDSKREQHIAGDADETRATPRSHRRRSTRPARGKQPNATPDGILQLPVRGEAQPAKHHEESDNNDDSAESDEAIVVAELEAQGFTPDEAIRLVHVSDRVATSREAREAEATLRRLRFTRWLIERGMLDEFSA